MATGGGGGGDGRPNPQLAVEGTVMTSLTDLMESEFTFSNGEVQRYSRPGEGGGGGEATGAANQDGDDDRASLGTVSMVR